MKKFQTIATSTAELSTPGYHQNSRKCDFSAKKDAENVIFPGFWVPKM